MKSQPDHNRITLLVVRDAGRPVRQLQLSRPLALALPAAAALSISSLVTSMHFHATRSISQLEAEAAALSQTNLRMEMKIADKDQALQHLRGEVSELSAEAESIKDKLKSVSELEEQLQSLIHNKKEAPSGKTSKTTSGSPKELSTVKAQVGGEYIAVYQNDPLSQIENTKDEFEEIHNMLDEMVDSISQTISEAKKAESAQAAIQAEKALSERNRRASAVLWPTLSKVISSSFGYRSDPFKGLSAFHSGIDIAGNIGDPVYAALPGKVIAVDQKGARGKYIIIEHANGLETWYMHLSGMNVSPGDKVRKGQTIGSLGNTGRSTGPHLHFQVVKQNKVVNPLTYVKP